MFTSEELRRAIVALEVIETLGDADEWAYVLREALDAVPSGEPWGNDPIGASIAAGLLARRLARLLGVDVGECERAAEVAFSKSRQRAVFNALLSYAGELRNAPWRPPDAAPAEARTSPAIRLVANTEGVA